MFKNVFYDKTNNILHLWEQVNGEDLYKKVKWVPYMFVRTQHKTDVKAVDGHYARKIKFSSFDAYKAFGKNANVSRYENRLEKATESQFLSDRYHHIPDSDIISPSLKIYSIDIEVKFGGELKLDKIIKKARVDNTVRKDVTVGELLEMSKTKSVEYWSDSLEIFKTFKEDDFIENKGNPVPTNPENEICLITIYDCSRKISISFGEKEFNPSNGSYYVHCGNEKEILRKFFMFMKKHPPDIITGWYVYDFDILYIINRSQVIFDDNIHSNLSPIGSVRTWYSNNRMAFDIAGVTVIDYLDLYKWYSKENLESHKLDFVCKHELGVGKLDYSEYKDLNDMYKNNWDKYVQYNIIDAKRVSQLEDKLGYLKLVQFLSLLTKTPMKFYNVMTVLIEGILLTYYRRNNMCAPFFTGGDQEHFPAAYVKHPKKGMHNWVISFDIASSYPSHIISLNMSNEVYIGRVSLNEDKIIESVKNRRFDDEFILWKHDIKHTVAGKTLNSFNRQLKNKKIAIAPCGTVFKTSPIGVLPKIERYLFELRKEVKKRIKILKNDDQIKNQDIINQLDTRQHAMKIVLNAAFGVCSVPYSRYFNLDIAEAITSCGRHTMKMGDYFVNEILSNPDDDIKDILSDI